MEWFCIADGVIFDGLGSDFVCTHFDNFWLYINMISKVVRMYDDSGNIE